MDRAPSKSAAAWARQAEVGPEPPPVPEREPELPREPELLLALLPEPELLPAEGSRLGVDFHVRRRAQSMPLSRARQVHTDEASRPSIAHCAAR